MKDDSQTHVWVRTDVIEAVLENQGRLPQGWKPTRKRGRSNEQWGWTRAIAVPASENSTPNRQSPYQQVRLRSTSQSRSSSPWKRSSKWAQNVPLHLTIDDDEFAPTSLQYRRVELHDVEDTVFMANSWWHNGAGPPDDLTSLPHLHEPAVVYCLKKRYEIDEIYTYTGKILLALNPFRSCRNLYGEAVMRRYWNNRTDERPRPHVYATAQDAYACMMRAMNTEDENQSILVSGESGAGKTVTTKIIMGYLTTLSRNTLGNNRTANENSDMESSGKEAR